MASHVHKYYHEEEPGTYKNLDQWLNYLLGVTILTFFLGVLTFGQPFSFTNHAFSYLGMTTTPDGSSNYLCMLVNAMGMLMSAFICFRISQILQESRSHWFFWLAGAGYIIMLIPCNLYNAGHMIGAALLVFGLWAFTSLHLFRLRSFTGWFKFLLYQLILQGTVLPYAVLYFLGSPDKQFMQKLAVAGLVMALKLTALELVHVSPPVVPFHFHIVKKNG